MTKGNEIDNERMAEVMSYASQGYEDDCWELVRHSTRDKGHEEGGSAYAKAGLSLGSLPGYSRASSPQNQSLPTLLLRALTSDFTGGCPPPPSRSLCQRDNLQLQLIKFLGN